MRPERIRSAAAKRLRRLADAARKCGQAEFVATGDNFLFGGLAWEWLRNRAPRDLRPLKEVAVLEEPGGGLERFCGALERRWRTGRPLAERVEEALHAAVLLRCALPEDFWLPIEADSLFVLLSPSYREMRVRAYNRAAYVVPFDDSGPKRPRWQPYLGSVSIAYDQHLPGRPDVLAAFWAIHELAHVVLITAPPAVRPSSPAPYVRWLLGQEGKAIATEIRISEELRSRLPHPAIVGYFNGPAVSVGFGPVRSVRPPSRRLLGAWLGLTRNMTPPRVPSRRTLGALRTNEEFSIGSLIYAIENRALYTCGARSELLRRMLPAPAFDPDPARALEREVRILLEGGTALDPRSHAAATRTNETVVLAFRLAELRDFLDALPGASPEAVVRLDASARRLADQAGGAGASKAAALAVEETLRREIGILRPFGFESRYADAHPSLFPVRA